MQVGTEVVKVVAAMTDPELATAFETTKFGESLVRSRNKLLATSS